MKENRFRDFDFSCDCPEFRERLRKRFLETARLQNGGLPLTDDELELVSAAGESNSPDGWNREKEKNGERRICGWKQEKYI